MIIKETILFEAYCDKCYNGMLKQFLDVGYIFKMQSVDFIGNKMKCDNCSYINKIKDAVIVVPGEYNIWSKNDLSKHKMDTGVTKFINEK